MSDIPDEAGKPDTQVVWGAKQFFFFTFWSILLLGLLVALLRAF